MASACPSCRAAIPGWTLLAFFVAVTRRCRTCGRNLRLSRRGRWILVGGAMATVVLTVAAETAATSPLAPVLAAGAGLWCTAVAVGRFGALERAES